MTEPLQRKLLESRVRESLSDKKFSLSLVTVTSTNRSLSDNHLEFSITH